MAEPEASTRHRRRVERRGRFTIITELQPTSPASSDASDDAAYPLDGDESDELHHASGEEGDVEAEDDDAAPRHSLQRDSAAAAVLMGMGTSERISPYGSAVFEHSNGSAAPTAENGAATAGIEAAVADGLDDIDGEDERRGRSETIDETADNRRVKRKGRFTIIELSSDSPRSRRDSAEEFSNTTSISVTSTQVTQANAHVLGTSPSTSTSYIPPSDPIPEGTASAVLSRMVSEHNTMATRTPRFGPMRDGQENDSRVGNRMRASSSMRSVSPLRDLGAENNSSSYHNLLSASFGAAPRKHVRSQSVNDGSYTTSPLLKGRLSSSPPTSLTMPSLSLSSSYSSVSASTPTAADKRPELGVHRRHLASRQKAITISAEQFIQQQNTIASLIRQQQELKQLIGVLAEQQQRLVGVPRPLADFGLDQSHSEAQEQTMRELQIQLGAVTRANDALQTLLTEAEQDAHERTMEIECLSNENNELRYRFSHMERRYRDEKKKSLTLEQELQRTRRSLHLARQKNDQQKQKLNRSSPSRELDDPIDQQQAVPKLL